MKSDVLETQVYLFGRITDGRIGVKAHYISQNSRQGSFKNYSLEKIQFVSLIYKQELPVAHGSLKLCPKTRAIRRAGDRVTGAEVIRPLSFIKRY